MDMLVRTELNGGSFIMAVQSDALFRADECFISGIFICSFQVSFQRWWLSRWNESMQVRKGYTVNLDSHLGITSAFRSLNNEHHGNIRKKFRFPVFTSSLPLGSPPDLRCLDDQLSYISLWTFSIPKMCWLLHFTGCISYLPYFH